MGSWFVGTGGGLLCPRVHPPRLLKLKFRLLPIFLIMLSFSIPGVSTGRRGWCCRYRISGLPQQIRIDRIALLTILLQASPLTMSVNDKHIISATNFQIWKYRFCSQCIEIMFLDDGKVGSRFLVT